MRGWRYFGYGYNPYAIVGQVKPSYDVAPHRANALAAAQKLYAATGNPQIGHRETARGSETTVFETLAGMRHWANEQGPDVWYAATFNLLASPIPTFELAR